MNVEEVLHMVGGAGETSYATNSRIQEKAIAETKSLVQETMAELYGAFLSESLAIADLGCSSGPNTLTVISEIIEAIGNTCRQLGRPPPEVQFFLNDLPGNDFNTIFRSLPSFKKKVKSESGEKSVPFYVVGVPGSFYGRLFPKKSIHFMHSCYSLHWLSQVPRVIETHANIGLNKWNIYTAKTSSPDVFKSYLEQYQSDFSTFLKLRSEEIKFGGQMVLTFIGRSNADASNGEYFFNCRYLADALNDMVLEGILQKEEVHTFNLPFYAPSMEEVRNLVQNEGSFDLKQEHIFETNLAVFDDYYEGSTSENFIIGEIVAKQIRAVIEPMVASHFGEAIIDDLFSRFAENVSRNFIKDEFKDVNFVISLKRV